VKALDVSLILYAEHEFNASTFTSRVISGTGSDIYSAVTGAIGALRGYKHGGANEGAFELIQRFRNADEAEQGILDMLENKEIILGFGHPVYTISDPRSHIIKAYARDLCDEFGTPYYSRLPSASSKPCGISKQLFPNLDFYSAVVYRVMGIPTRMFTPLFVMSRITGWTAHILEQRLTTKLSGPAQIILGRMPRPYIPLDERR
jgi:2-methylcitrate synthase